MKKGKLTAEMLEQSAWAAALAAIVAPVEAVPPGWQTAQQIASKTKVPVATLQQKLKRLVDGGQAERKMFRVRLKQLARPVPHYKLK
jgi:hypothetical protein